MKIAVIGTGSGGQATGGHLALLGHEVRLYGRDEVVVKQLLCTGAIALEGMVNGIGKLEIITNDLRAAIADAAVIIIVTTADAHGRLAAQLSGIVEEGQIIVLSPGRTGGALVFQKVMQAQRAKKTFLAEAQTLRYACRMLKPGAVRIIGIKSRVFFSSLPAGETGTVLDALGATFSYYVPASSVLETSLENIGAILHPPIMLFKANAISNSENSYFYRDVSRLVADYIEMLDEERMQLGKMYGIDLTPVRDWVSLVYSGVTGNSLLERMRSNPAYYDILAPRDIMSRQLFEDIPTGLVPMLGLAEIAGIDLPQIKALVELSKGLLGVDFTLKGRDLKTMGLNYCSNCDDVIRIVS